MQINSTSYLHYGHRYCTGYIEYLKKRNNGKIISFNWQALFFNFFWLCYHRMYKEVAVLMLPLFSLLYFYAIRAIGEYTVVIFLITFYMLFFLFSHYLYENHCELKFWKNKDKKDIYKSIKPYNFFLSIIIFMGYTMFLIIFYVKAFSFLIP